MNKIKFMTIILVMVASLVGCSMEEESGEVLENKPSAITSKTINLTMMQPETINPITNKNKSVGYIMNLIYDSLFTIDENYDTVPQLVEEYKIENDGMSINIKLKDIKWHDGTTLTSSDVKFTVDLIKQNIDSPYNALVENISSILIINDKEFNINFNDKYAFSMYSDPLKCSIIVSTSLTLSTSTTLSFILVTYSFFKKCLCDKQAIQSGIFTLTLSTGNSNKASFNISYISFSFSISTLIGITGTSYFFLNSSANFSVSKRVGWAEFNITIKGLPISFNSDITFSSAST